MNTKPDDLEKKSSMSDKFKKFISKTPTSSNISADDSFPQIHNENHRSDTYPPSSLLPPEATFHKNNRHDNGERNNTSTDKGNSDSIPKLRINSDIRNNRNLADQNEYYSLGMDSTNVTANSTLQLNDLHWLDKDNVEQPSFSLNDNKAGLYRTHTLSRGNSNKSELSRNGSEINQDEMESGSEKSLVDLMPHIDYSDFILEPAQKKRNYEFHQLFPSLPLDDILVEDYMCALHKEILISGRMYVGTNHVCFHSTLFVWTTNLTIPYKDIITMEKRSTAYVIPNAIQINTLENKYFFTSFVTRDQVYAKLYPLWTRRCPQRASLMEMQSSRRKIKPIEPHKQLDSKEEVVDEVVADDKTLNTSCRCLDEDGSGHSGVKSIDCIFNTELQTMFNLLYSTNSKDFLTNMFEESNNSDIVIEDWDTSPDDVVIENPNKCTRNMSYVKALNNTLGPKSTRCIIVEDLIAKDITKAITVVNSCKNPDVPSGGSFTVVSTYCLTVCRSNLTRLQVFTEIVWSKSSWLKGPIESASKDGVMKSCKFLKQKIEEYLDIHKDLITGPGIGDEIDEDFHLDETVEKDQDQTIFQRLSTWIPLDYHIGIRPFAGLILLLVLTNCWHCYHRYKIYRDMEADGSSLNGLDNRQLKILYRDLDAFKQVVSKLDYKIQEIQSNIRRAKSKDKDDIKQ